MTLSADAITALTTVFEHADIAAITEKFYFYDLMALIQQGSSDQYTVRALYQTEVNFWQCLVKPSRIVGTVTTVNSELTVELSYVRQIDVAGENYQIVADSFETFLTAMVATIGYKWSGNISVYQVSQPAGINIVTVAEKDCWQANFSLNATI